MCKKNFFLNSMILQIAVMLYKIEIEAINPSNSSNTLSRRSNGTNIKRDVVLPEDCSQREKLKVQPFNDQSSSLKKCCPIGESLSIFQENSSRMCDFSDLSFEPQVINAVLYDNCIEDEELSLSLPFEIRNPCNASFFYNSEADRFYVMQDGSLLIIDEFANDTYSVTTEYCMDIDILGNTYAFVCISSVDEHINRSSIILIATLMLISIPCLIFVSYVHIRLPQLRSVHGLALANMSLSLAIGYCMHSCAYIFEKRILIGYTAQFFMLSYFFWFCVICLNTAINIWSFFQSKNRNRRVNAVLKLMIYACICFGGSMIFVFLTAQKGFPGMPSYFLQGYTECKNNCQLSIRESQRYFIPPITVTLLGSFVILVICFFGFKKVEKASMVSDNSEGFYGMLNLQFDWQYYHELKKDAKCVTLMGIVIFTSWLLEVVTFYTPGPENYLILMDTINGLQGIFVFLIFLVVRRRRDVILRWWHDHGSHNIEKIELSSENE